MLRAGNLSKKIHVAIVLRVGKYVTVNLKNLSLLIPVAIVLRA